jgi:hypothetical protein
MREAPGMQHDATSIDDAAIARIADRASVDPRTVIRRLAGLPVRGRAGARVDAALAEYRSSGPSLETGAPSMSMRATG